MGIPVPGDVFTIGASAKDANDYYIYNSDTGAFFYDQDGTGSREQIQLFQLSPGLNMTYENVYSWA